MDQKLKRKDLQSKVEMLKAALAEKKLADGVTHGN